MVRVGANANSHHQPQAPRPTAPPPFDDEEEEDEVDLNNHPQAQTQNIHGMQQSLKPPLFDDEDDDDLNTQAQPQAGIYPRPPIHGMHQFQQPSSQLNFTNQTGPPPHTTVVVVPGPPQPVPILYPPSTPPPLSNQPWNTNLFDCLNDPQNAMITLLCPCVTFGQIAEVLDYGNSSCASRATSYTCVALCIAMPCLISCSYRSKMRGQFGLEESPAPDWLVHCFFEPCALCQEYRELQHRGLDPSLGWEGNAERKRRQQQEQHGMAPPMQQTMNTMMI